LKTGGNLKTTKLLLILIFSCAAFNLFSDSTDPIVNPQKKLPTYLRFSGGGQLQFHLKGSSNNDSNIPDQYEDNSVAPSIHDFFKNGGGLRFSIDIKHLTSKDKAIVFGYEYEQSNLNIIDQDFALLGETLSITSHIPYFCFGRMYDDNFGFIKLGIPIMTYEGKGKFNEVLDDGTSVTISTKTRYKDTVAFRIGAGVEGKLHKGLRVLFGADLNVLKTKPDKITYSYNGESISSVIESDDIEDTHLSLYVQLCYQFKLK